MIFSQDDKDFVRSEVAAQMRHAVGFEPPPALAADIANEILTFLSNRMVERARRIPDDELLQWMRD